MRQNLVTVLLGGMLCLAVVAVGVVRTPAGQGADAARAPAGGAVGPAAGQAGPPARAVLASAGREAGPAPARAGEDDGARRFVAVTSNTILADLVAQVAGERWEVRSLLPPGADPHGFEPTPADARRMAVADLVVMVGGGYETPALARMIRAAAPRAKVASMEPLLVAWGEPWHSARADHGGDWGSAGREGYEAELDPHFWTSVPATARAVRLIGEALAEADRGGAEAYRVAAERYAQRLQELDAWVRRQVGRIPEDRRVLVTNHDTLRYFAREYGFSVEGSLIPSVSSLAEPAAADLARLLGRLRQLRVPAIFVETTLSPSLARRLARDAGARVVVLYTDSLGEPGSGADTYEGYVRTNVTRIVEALAAGGTGDGDR